MGATMQQTWRAAAGGVLGAGLALLVIYALLPSAWSRFVTMSDYPQLFDDFVFFYYRQAQVFLAGGPVGFGYVYGPIFAWVLAPLTLLAPPAAAGALWNLASLLAMWLAAGFALERAWPGRAATAFGAAAFVLLTAFPVWMLVRWGQIGGWLTVAAALALVGDPARGRGVRAVLLGFAVAVKFYPALYLLWFAARRDGRMVAMTLCAAGAFTLAPIVWCGPARWLADLAGVANNLTLVQGWGVDDPNTMYLPYVLGRWWLWLQVTLTGTAAPVTSGLILPALSAAGFLALLFVMLRCSPDFLRDGGFAFAVLSAALPLVVAPCWTHYLVATPLAAAFALPRVQAVRVRRRVAAFALVAAGLAIQSILVFAWWDNWVWYTFSGLPLVGDLSVLAACGLVAGEPRNLPR